MPIDSFLIKILIVLFPGIIGFYIFHTFRATKANSIWEGSLEIFCFSFSSYLLKSILSNIYHLHKISINEINPKNINAILFNSNISWSELFWVSLISIFIGIIVSIVYNYKLVNRIGNFLCITNKYGDEDVWEYMFNSPNIEWIFIRDYEKELTYFGYVKNFSDSKKDREILLTNVTVYTFKNSKLIDTIPAVYLFITEKCVIEIPKLIGDIPSTLSILDFDLIEKFIIESSNKSSLSIAYKKKDNEYIVKKYIAFKNKISIQNILFAYNQSKEVSNAKTIKRRNSEKRR